MKPNLDEINLRLTTQDLKTTRQAYYSHSLFAVDFCDNTFQIEHMIKTAWEC